MLGHLVRGLVRDVEGRRRIECARGADQVARTIPGVARATAVSAGLGHDVFGHGFARAVVEGATAVCWGDLSRVVTVP